MGGSLTIFEEPQMRDHCAELYPHLAADYQTWDELLTAWGEPPPPTYETARAGFREALAATPAATGDWLTTVELLREAPLRTVEDVEFAFSYLPENEKNRFLRQLVDLYFQSPLIEGDRVARTLRWMARAEMGEADFPLPADTVFLRGRSPSPLFEEFSQTIGKITPVRYLESWQRCPSEEAGVPFARVALRSGRRTQLLDRFCAKVAREFRRRPRGLQVMFNGSDASRAYLRARLAFDGLHVIAEDNSASPDARAAFFEKLRAAPLPLSERLKLSALWMIEPAPELESWMEKHSLAPDRREFLRSWKGPAPSHEGDIRLLPFHPLPMEKAAVALAYVERIPEPPVALALDAAERRRLRAGGFLVPESEPHLERNAQRLAGTAHRGPGHFFLFIDEETPLEGWRAHPLRAHEITVRGDDPAAAPVLEPGVLSATALDTYAECPAKYLYRQGLRLQPRQSPEEQFALWFGKLTHSALETVLRENHRAEVTEERLTRKFDALVEANAESLGQSAWLKVALRRRFRPMARHVPEMEKALREITGAEPERFEEDFEVALDGTRFRGRMDRIDRLPSGERIVLDYKTGTVDFSPEQIRKGKDFQALLYWLAAREKLGPTAGVLFYDLKRGEIRRGLVRSEALPNAKSALTRGHALEAEKFDAILAEGRGHLTRLVSRIQRQDFAATPSPQACEYCEYGDHCRARFGWAGGGG